MLTVTQIELGPTWRYRLMVRTLSSQDKSWGSIPHSAIMAKLCIVQHCAVYNDIAPYIQIITADAHATVNSIYRGDPAAWLLHRYGKTTQREIYEQWIHGQEPNPANPPGFSTHELFSDGYAYPVPRGHKLAWWQQGFDVNDGDVGQVMAQAHKHGWIVWQPYKSGSEFHHLNFRQRPRPGRSLARIMLLRHSLPRR